MPVEEHFDARAVALPLDDDDDDDDEPPDQTLFATCSRRSHLNSLHQNGPHSTRYVCFKGRIRRLTDKYNKLTQKFMDQCTKLSLMERVLYSVGGLTIFVLSILFLVCHQRMFHASLSAAKKWREITAGWLILWGLMFVVSFPPLMGYASLLTTAGFVYGFPNGWFIAATATVAGSTACFVVSRYFFKNTVHQIVSRDKRFAALALTLKHDGLKLLIMIRLCPLPYSLCNGAIAAFPTVSAVSYGLATAIVSPGLMLTIFIGSQLAVVAEDREQIDAESKALSCLGIAVASVAGVVTALFIYEKTKQQAAQLEAEERTGIHRMSVEDLELGYADMPDVFEATEMVREDDAATSLRAGWGDEYHDDLAGYGERCVGDSE